MRAITTISFSRKDRDLLQLVRAIGVEPKEIACDLEVSVATVNDRINAICQRARVTRAQLAMWVLQNPTCLEAGSIHDPGLDVASY